MRRTLLALAAAALLPCHALPKVALDTDIGTDFDDMWALMFLLSKSIPGDATRLFDFALVQCSTFNTTDRARITTKAMFDVGRFDVPVAVGRYTGEDRMPQLPAADGWTLDDFVRAGGTVLYGEDRLAQLLAEATPASPLFVVEIAPATSLGDVVRATPALAANAIVSAMSGSVYHGYGNSSLPQSEYNVKEDVAASQAMYAASWLSPLLMSPLDTSGLLHCVKPEFADLIAANNSDHVYAQVLLKNYQIWCNCVPTVNSASDTLYDAQAAVATVSYTAQWAPGSSPPAVPGLTLEALRISVNDTGFTVIDPAAQLVWAATRFPDGLVTDTHLICGELISSIIAA